MTQATGATGGSRSKTVYAGTLAILETKNAPGKLHDVSPTNTLNLQANAEQAVRELLRDFSTSQGLKEVDTVSAEEHMDDGTPIRLAVTIDRKDGSALLDFEGMLCMLCMLCCLRQSAGHAVLPGAGHDVHAMLAVLVATGCCACCFCQYKVCTLCMLR